MLLASFSLSSALLLGSCEPLFQSSSETVVAREPSTYASVSHVASQDLLRAQSFLCGSRLTVVLTALHACEESSARRVTVERRTIRDASVPLFEFGIGVAGVAVSAVLSAAHLVGVGCNESDPPQCHGSEAGTLGALAGLVVGTGFLVAAEPVPGRATSNDAGCATRPPRPRS